MSLVTLEYVDVLDGENEKKVLEFSTELLPEPINMKSLFAIKVDGESMQPVIQDRALVVADLSQRVVEHQGIYLVYQSNSMWIKQANQEDDGTTFISINKAFSHLIFKEEEVRVVAKVVLAFSTFQQCC